MKQPEWTTVQRYPSGFRFPDGESFSEMQTRIGACLRAAARAATRAACSWPSPTPTPSRRRSTQAMGAHLDLFQRIAISTCSITAIAYGTNGPMVLTVNSTGGSLAELRPS